MTACMQFENKSYAEVIWKIKEVLATPTFFVFTIPKHSIHLFKNASWKATSE